MPGRLSPHSSRERKRSSTLTRSPALPILFRAKRSQFAKEPRQQRDEEASIAAHRIHTWTGTR